jgi:hypothetical protein
MTVAEDEISLGGAIGPSGDRKYERSGLTRPCPPSWGRLAGWRGAPLRQLVGSTTRSQPRVRRGAGQGERYGKPTENGSPKRQRGRVGCPAASASASQQKRGLVTAGAGRRSTDR